MKLHHPPQQNLRQRDHPRVPVEVEVALMRIGAPTGIAVQSKDLSWGGTNIIASGRPLELDDSVVLRFPWRQDDSFAVRGRVVWNSQIGEDKYLSGLSFYRLTVSDEEKLRKLLSMLTRTKDGRESDDPLAEMLEMRFLDRREMLAALEQIRLGAVETTAFKPYRENQRLRFHLVGFSDLPTLRLRARVLWQKAFSQSGPAQNSGLFRVALALDHPMEDLKRVTAPLIERLLTVGKDGSCVLLDQPLGLVARTPT